MQYEEEVAEDFKILEIPEPLVKRTFHGGLYAAHVLRTWEFEDWRLLREWVNASDKYDNDWGSMGWISPETVAYKDLKKH